MLRPCSEEMGIRLRIPSPEIFGGCFHALRVDFVDGKEERLAGALKQAGEIEVGAASRCGHPRP